MSEGSASVLLMSAAPASLSWSRVTVPTSGRVVRMLHDHSVGEGEVRVVADRMTQQDIADRVGASREMISRIFKDLAVGGYIAIERHRITILKKPPAAW